MTQLDLRRYLNVAFFFLVEMTRRPEMTLGYAVAQIEEALGEQAPETEEDVARNNARAMEQLGMMLGQVRPA